MVRKANLLMDINYKKLLKQDKAFKEFYEDFIKAFLAQHTDNESLRFIYSMYQTGLSPKEVAKFVRRMTK